MKTPLIFDIKRASTTDGPGLRTVAFFKGCNLECFWCHNPEGKSPVRQLALFREKCTDCGACRLVCASPDECSACGRCASVCMTQARKMYGQAYTADALLDVFRADKPYYDATGGGVTFSGGECMLYPDFAAELAQRCHAEGITVAIDTAGHVPYASFEKVLPHADIFLYDVKCLDGDIHRKGTGVDNRLILENLEKLRQTGRRIIIRTPEIPGFNMGEEVERVRAYCAARGLEHEVLSYHAMGESKLTALTDAVKA